jgi:hypothetical protein
MEVDLYLLPTAIKSIWLENQPFDFPRFKGRGLLRVDTALR